MMQLPVLAFLLAAALPAGPVIVNEIHYDPADETVPEEFVELLNWSDAAVDLSGWSLSGAVGYVCAQGTVLGPRQYLVVAQNPAALRAAFGDVPVLGPFTGRLANDGETVVLRDPQGAHQDEVDYRRGFPWPTAGGSGGHSIELIHPDLDNSLGGSWRLSAGLGGGDEVELVAAGSTWRYLKGTSEASSPVSAWRQVDFNDSGWSEGRAALGYGETFIVTPLADMQGGYASVFLRRRFTVEDPAAVRALVLEVRVDDGINAWINSTHVVRLNLPSEEMPFNGLALSVPENQSFLDFRLSAPETLLHEGENILCIQLHNVSLASSDAFLDARLVALPSGSGPTPGGRNTVFAEDAPPQLRQLEHTPQEPRSGQPVTITVRATDPQGVEAVTLEYQTVDPGGYVRLTDPAYATRWTALELRDDGISPDQEAGDDVFSAQIPAAVQTNRRLVRYRLEAQDSGGNTVRVPFPDDPQPNFAYFVYDGVPAWRGASRPGATPVRQFSAALMASLPVYHLIALETDVLRSQYDGAYEDVHFLGTMVYDGEVYDHLEFENRGEFSTYVSGKNKWRFHFRRGHEFRSRDNYGVPRRARWRTMNFSPCSTPWVPPNRGMAGLDESVAFRLYELAGVPSPRTGYVHFRVIDEALEAHATDQYRGDLWGLYLTLEHTDGAFLEERGLPDGNTYKIEGGNGDQRNQGATQPKGGADYNTFRNGFNSTQPITWWRANADLEGYYAMRAVDRAVNNMDLRDGWNHCQYHNPLTNRWTAMPWDLDMLYMPVTHWSGVINVQNCILQHPSLRLEYQARARELQDLLFTPDQTGELIAELAAFVSRPGDLLTFAHVDEAMWNEHPRTAGSHRDAFYRNPASQGFIGGTVNRTLVSADHAGMARWIEDFTLSGYGASRLEEETADSAIPAQPVIGYTGAAGFPVDGLAFRASAFSDPQGPTTFGAMKWRIAEITAPGSPRDPYRSRRYEVEPCWESPLLTTFEPELQVPPGVLRIGATHRARVRMRDTTGRWSRWSEPVEFIAGPALSPSAPQRFLRITEVFYHPADAPDLEFVEVKNLGAESLDLRGVSLREGVEFSFAGSAVEDLPGGALAVVVKDRWIFEARYGREGIAIAGEYQGSLSNGGDRLALVHGPNGTVLDFDYSDAWVPSTDGGGRSLVFADPALPAEAWQDPSNWTESAEDGGSPGRDEPAPPGPRQLPGDLNQDGALDLSDAVALLLHLFAGGLPPPCEGGAIDAGGNLALADFDGDAALVVTDAVALLQHLFRGGPGHALGDRCLPLAGCPGVCPR